MTGTFRPRRSQESSPTAFGRRRSGCLDDLSCVAAERSPEQPVDHLIEEEGVDLVAAPDEFVADAHEVFDDRGDFFECEADSTFVSQPRPRSVGWPGSLRRGPEGVDVFGSERAGTTTDVDGMEATVSDRGDELGRGES